MMPMPASKSLRALCACAALVAVTALAAPAMAECTTRTTGSAQKTRCDDGSSYTIRTTGGITRYSGDETGEARAIALSRAQGNGYIGRIGNGTAVTLGQNDLNDGPVIINGRVYEPQTYIRRNPNGGAAGAAGYITGTILKDRDARTTVYFLND